MNALRDTYDGDFEILAVPSSNFLNVSQQIVSDTFIKNRSVFSKSRLETETRS